MRKADIYTYKEFMTIIKKYISNPDEIKLVEKAYSFADEKHFGQKRKSGEEYIQHVINTAVIAVKINPDVETVCASLLHDVIEDCDVKYEELEKMFNPEIAKLVKSVSKLSSLKYKLDNENMANNYRRIIIGMSEDVRTIIIKLSDRLHNLRTLWAVSEEKQKKIAKETLEILTPIAHRLGINKVKSEMEDICLKHLKPDVYSAIVEKLNKTKKDRDSSVAQMIENVSILLEEHNIKHEIKGRAKSIYSIYKKMEQGRKFEDIYDLHALRIILDTEVNCYTALGIIHSKYKPMPNRFKDYIAQPKSNMYQSLHTTVFGVNSFLYEIQIRTYEMDEVAELGIASHVSYKEKANENKLSKNIAEQKIKFFREILDLQESSENSVDFLENIKNDIFKANIYVYTPKGDVVELPVDSTPIDFAYKVHSEVGNKMTGAIVNNKGVSLDYKLKTGDIIKVVTSSTSKGPNKEWIDIAKTAQAKNKIKAFYSKTTKEIKTEQGEKELLAEIRKRKLVIKDIQENEAKSFMKRYKIESLEDLYIHIANDKYTPLEIITYGHKEEEEKHETKTIKRNIGRNNDIIVQGINNIKINIGNCCEPIPGDKIIGYITKGNGISIHRATCKNLINEQNKMIDVEWNELIEKKYSTTILVHCNRTEETLIDIVTKAKINNILIESVQNFTHGEESVYQLTIKVKNLEELNKYIKDINTIKKVSRITRQIN